MTQVGGANTQKLAGSPALPSGSANGVNGIAPLNISKNLHSSTLVPVPRLVPHLKMVSVSTKVTFSVTSELLKEFSSLFFSSIFRNETLIPF